MRNPKPGNSATYLALQAIHAKGSITLNELLIAVPTLKRTVFYALKTQHRLKVDRDTMLYSLPDHLTRHFNGEVLERVVTPTDEFEVVPPPRINRFTKQMIGYGASLLTACRRPDTEIRDTSFLNGSITGGVR